MLYARVWRARQGDDGDGDLILDRVYADPDLSLQAVIKKMENYVVEEKLNIAGMCTIRVRFGGWDNLPAR